MSQILNAGSTLHAQYIWSSHISASNTIRLQRSIYKLVAQDYNTAYSTLVFRGHSHSMVFTHKTRVSTVLKVRYTMGVSGPKPWRNPLVRWQRGTTYVWCWTSIPTKFANSALSQASILSITSKRERVIFLPCSTFGRASLVVKVAPSSKASIFLSSRC